MVLTRPVTKTKISTTEFGQPVYDWITTYGTPTAWVDMILMNGYAAESGMQKPQYRRWGDTVQLRGSVTCPASAAGKILWNAPSGFRVPVKTRVYSVYYDSGAAISKTARCDFDTGGNLTFFDFTATAVFLMLNNVNFYTSA